MLPSADEGRFMVFLDGQPLASYPRGKSASEAELGLGFISDGTLCALCGQPTNPMTLTWFCEGRVVCPRCAPCELVEYLDLAYEYVDDLEAQPSRRGDADWILALCEYVMMLKGDEVAATNAPSPLRSVPQMGESTTV
jgi:hypothetical protein